MLDILQQILYFFGHGFCHQYPWRSLEAGGLYFAVCSRDTGIYLGFILTLAIYAIAIKLPGTQRNQAKPSLTPAVVALGIILVLPMALDGASSYLGLRETDNLTRYVTGYLCGCGLAIVVSGSVLKEPLIKAKNPQTSLMYPCTQRSVFGLLAINQWFLNIFAAPTTSVALTSPIKPLQLAALLAISCVVGAAFYLGYPYLGAAAAFIVLASLWLSVALINLLVLSSTRLWSQKQARRQRAAMVCLALAAALVEMAALSLVAHGVHLLFPWYVHP